jgi:isomerase DpgB
VSSFADLTDVYLAVGGGASLSGALVGRVNEACDLVEQDADKNLTVLVHLDGANSTGAGEPWPPETPIHLVNRWERALRRLERLPAVVLAVASGVCRGPAFDLLLATDYRVATEDLRLEIAGAAGSAWPGMALHRMANQLGLATARRLVLLGAPVSVAGAVAVGLVDETAADVLPRVRSVLQTLSGVHGRELAIRRQLMFEAGTTSFEDALGAHLSACDRALRLERRGLDAAPALGPRF